MLTPRTRTAIRQAGDDIRAAFLPLLGFNLVVAAVSAVVFTPFIAWTFRRLVSTTGKNVLSDFEIAGFLLSPFGIAALVIMLVIILAVGIFSSAGYMQILLTQVRGARPAVISTLVVTLQALPQIAGLIGRVVLILLVLALPVLAGVTFLALPLISEFDINYYLSARPPEFFQALAVSGVLVLVLLAGYIYLFVGWSMSVPLLLFRGLAPGEALRGSRDFVAGRRGEIAWIIFSWVLTVVVITAVLGLLGKWITGLVLSFQSNLGVTVVLMAILMAFNGAVALLVSFLILTSLNAVLVRLYIDMAGEESVSTAADDETERILHRIRNMPRSAWWAAGLGLAVLVTGFSWYLLKDIDLDADVLIIAHRGSSLAAPENTMAAVNLALDEAADYVEIDVQETADGIVVVVHDADLNRVAGVPRPIADVTLAETADMDIGSWFDPEFAGERLATLRQVLDAAEGRAGVNIELKFTDRAVDLTRRVLDVVREAGAEGRVEYMSLSYDGTQEIRRLDPDASVGFLSNVSIGNLTDTNVDFLAVSSRTATRSFIANAQDAGMLVYVWTVNTPLEMALFIDRGVDGIITDAPALLNDVIAELNEASVAERLLLRFSNEFALDVGESEQ